LGSGGEARLVERYSDGEVIAQKVYPTILLCGRCFRVTDATVAAGRPPAPNRECADCQRLAVVGRPVRRRGFRFLQGF
jgi:hypothetical protein